MTSVKRIRRKNGELGKFYKSTSRNTDAASHANGQSTVEKAVTLWIMFILI